MSDDKHKPLLLIVCIPYFISVGIFALYFNWQYAQEHGFKSWLFFGDVVATLKAIAWPVFILPLNIIRDFAVNVVVGAILLLSLSRLIARVQFSLSNAFWLSLIGQTLLSISGFVIGLFSHQTEDGSTTELNVIALIVGLFVGCFLLTVLFQIAARTQKDVLTRWRAVILSIIFVLGGVFVASPLIELWENNGQRNNVDWKKCQEYRVNADRGVVDAQYMLGVCYYKGRGVKKDYSQAVRWFRKAAEQNDADGQYMLGRCYNEGAGVKANLQEGVMWWRKAAEQGSVNAQFNLAYCYRNGAGTEKNYTEALRWFRKAADQGAADAQYMLGVSYAYGESVEQNMSESLKWFRKAADQGYANAQAILGSSYYSGTGVETNYEEAVKWFRMAAEQGYASAQDDLGICYANGEGVEKDYVEAFAWYSLASKANRKSAVALEQIERKMSRQQIKAAEQRTKELAKEIEKRTNEIALDSKQSGKEESE